MLTGNSRKTTETVADKLDTSQVKHNALPGQKFTVFGQLKDKVHPIAMSVIKNAL